MGKGELAQGCAGTFRLAPFLSRRKTHRVGLLERHGGDGGAAEAGGAGADGHKARGREGAGAAAGRAGAFVWG
jgi:hypothetical protein